MVLPIMGKSIDTEGAQMTIRYMSMLPAILVVCFLFLNIYMRSKKHS
jgi:hypothetical protein